MARIAYRRCPVKAVGPKILHGDQPCQVFAMIRPLGMKSPPRRRSRRPTRHGRQTPIGTQSAALFRSRLRTRLHPHDPHAGPGADPAHQACCLIRRGGAGLFLEPMPTTGSSRQVGCVPSSQRSLRTGYQMSLPTRKIGRVGCLLGYGQVAGGLDEPAELGVSDSVRSPRDRLLQPHGFGVLQGKSPRSPCETAQRDERHSLRRRFPTYAPLATTSPRGSLPPRLLHSAGPGASGGGMDPRRTKHCRRVPTGVSRPQPVFDQCGET